jgi:hypothetical protein
MVDNVAITPGTGATIAADDIGGALHQRVKLTWGTDGNAVDASASAPLPVVQTGTNTVELGATDNAVLDAIAASLSTLDNTVSGNELQVDVLTMPTTTVTNTPLTNFGAGEYETVAAGQTAQTLGATGATGDFISGILVVPATTSPGNVLLLDNATSITVFTGGASSVSNLVPFFIPLGMISVSGAWKITTGSNVSCIGIGNFA